MRLKLKKHTMVRNKLLLILGFVLFTSNVKAQVINYVKYEWQADIKVYFVNYEYESDITVFRTNFKYKASKPGYWWWDDKGENGDEYSSDKLNVWVCKYKYQSDYSVYISTFPWEIILTDRYINEVWKR